MSRNLDLLTGTWRETKTQRNRAPEAAVKKAAETYLRGIGGYVRTINSGGTMRGGRWTSSGQGSGISDLLCWLPFGIFLAVELKAPGKKRTATDEQFKFLEETISRGFKGCIADSVDCIKLALGQNREELLTTLHSFKPQKRVRNPSKLDPLFP